MPRKRRDEHFWLHQGPGERVWSIWCYDAVRSRTKRRSTGERDRDRAEIKLAKHILKHHKPQNAEPETVALGQVLVTFLKEHAIHLASAEAAMIATKHLNRFFGDCLVSDITPQSVDNYIEARREKVTNSTISRELAVLRASLNRAHKRNMLRSVPFITDVEKNSPPPRKLDIDQMARLVNSIRHPHVMDWFMAAATTLARPENILDVTRFQLDFSDRIIRLNLEGRRQTKKYRPIVPMCGTFSWWFADMNRAHLVEYAGQQIKSMRTAVRKLRKNSDLPETFVAKSIRHTMATELRRRGVSVDDLAGVLGHRRARLTELYGEYSPDYLGAVSRAIDAYFADLQERVDRPITPEFRPILSSNANNAHALEAKNPLVSQGVILVEPSGIEPLTSTMPL
jgi:hypothetical protein